LPDAVAVSYRGILPHEQVVAVLSNYDLFFLPSRGESFGHVIFEALTAGCPVLISDRTPWQGVAAYGAGWDVPLEDPAKFRAILQECIDMNSDEWQRTSAQARAYALLPERQRAALEQSRQLFSALLPESPARLEETIS
jgi:glycosyltransferase involved in cell wall biosynthesis